MKKMILTALAGAALLTMPLAAPSAAQAAEHSFRGAGGFHGGFRGGGFYRGGFGYYGYPGYFYGAGLGFALGAAFADPWYYGPAYYGYYGYYGPPGPVVAYAQPPAYSYAPAPQGPAPQAACGQWSWNQAQSKYDWVAGPCAPAPAPVQVN